MPAIDGLGVLEQRSVDKVAAVLLYDVQQAKAELEFRDELEVRQVDVAAHADLQVDVERLEAQGIVLACGEVDHRIDAGYEVRAEVVVARCGKLQVDGHGDIGALEDLRAVGSALLLVVDGMLLPEVNGRRQTQGQVFVQPQVADDAHREARAVVVDFGIPLLARLGVDVAVVLQLEVLHVQSQQETVMQPPLVDVRAVLHLTLLCCQAQGEKE